MSSKVDGVPRELLEDMLNPCADFATHDRLRALLDAPVVERQPKAWLTGKCIWEHKNSAQKHSDCTGQKVEPLYTAPPELAELQATVARLTAENERLKDEAIGQYAKRVAVVEEIERLKSESFEALYNDAIDEIERLKGGQGEAVAWGTMQPEFSDDDRTLITDKDYAEVYDRQCYTLTPLFASQPAALSVALPDRREPTPGGPYLTDADHEWNACLDKVKELNQ
jgi:cell division protein FtsB